MHELSICGSIAGIVTQHAVGRRVEKIHVQVGQLRQIVPDTLVYCWALVSADTALDGSVLEVDNVRASIACRDCEETTEIGKFPMFLCGTCGSSQVSVVAGDEFLITSIDISEG
ncbi:hydrogenase maturation nickel metallochaperone HypA [Streptomyces bottropensis]|uniref:Hydrogenase maturation factor HypA n=1 Tax=Streptomyces bottropensis TaxID=42235 RepID=A0ABU8B155_9ACTN|nr:hydrogenase maturation nickel metallochaperone HypA [Streptomyces bottropensis]MZD20395.1 hydrogenase maturation nickel metallochaperone HypA [Streptomyces sp. SID5476]